VVAMRGISARYDGVKLWFIRCKHHSRQNHSRVCEVKKNDRLSVNLLYCA